MASDSNFYDMGFNINLANDLAELESHNKHLYRPNTYLHKWWARRCGTTFRAILKNLVEDCSQKDFYSSKGLEGKIILDPMMGGGTTVHEAIRLGANVIGADIDPIPVLQARASLSQQVTLEQLNEKFHEFYHYIYNKIGHLYTTDCPHCSTTSEFKFTLYGLKKNCNCSNVVVVDSLILRHETDGSTVKICDKCYGIYKDVHHCCGVSEHKPKLIEKKEDKVCSECKGEFVEDKNIPFNERYVPLVIVGECKEHGLFFKPLEHEDQLKIADAQKLNETIDFGDIEGFKIKEGPKSKDLLSRNISLYTELFSERQALYIYYSLKWLNRQEDALIKLNFALLISTSLEFNSLLCGYKGGEKRRPGAIRHVFAHHAYTFPFTALENNPLFPDKRASGSLYLLFDTKINKGRTWAKKPIETRIEIKPDGTKKNKKVPIKGEIDGGVEVKKFEELLNGCNKFMLLQGSSTNLNIPDESVDFIVTDPPYYNSVQYSDLAAFFRAWLKQMVPTQAEWDYDVSQSAVDTDGSGLNYERLLGLIFSECYRVLKKQKGLMIFTFHHWDYKAWDALSKALRFSNFKLVNKFVIHSENPSSVHIKNINSLKHDAILVLAPMESRLNYEWEIPYMVNKNSSEEFTNDCATVMGWILNSSLSSEQVTTVWKDLLN